MITTTMAGAIIDVTATGAMVIGEMVTDATGAMSVVSIAGVDTTMIAGNFLPA